MSAARALSKVDMHAAPIRMRRGEAALALRRSEILNSAGKVIAEMGLSETTIERVAREAAVSPGTVINYFPTKDALLKAVLESVAQEFEAARREIFEATPDDPVRTLEALIVMMFDAQIASPRKIAIWYAFWGEPSSRQLYLQRVGALDQRFEADLLAVFEQLVATHDTPLFDTDAAYRGFAGLLEWSWQEILTAGPRIDRQKCRQRARNYLSNLFPRHFPPDPAPTTNESKTARLPRRNAKRVKS